MSLWITRSRGSYSEKGRLLGKRRQEEDEEEDGKGREGRERERESERFLFLSLIPSIFPLLLAPSSPTGQKNTADKRSLTEQKPQTYGAGFLIVTVLVMGVVRRFNGGDLKGVAASLLQRRRGV